VKELIKLVKRDGAASVASRVRDTLRTGDDISEMICLGKAVNRENLWALGTPQGFRYPEILRAHERAQRYGNEVTDDTQLVSKGRKIGVLEVDMLNFKITYPEDIEFAVSLIPIWKKRSSGWTSVNLSMG
jgi:2-C-methyl-D-erythritol 4-phosphate cytidylyltransferase